MPTLFVDIHFIGFEVIELFAYWGFVFGGQSCPRFVSTTVIFVARCNFDIVIKFDYLKKKVKIFRASYFFLYFQKLNNKRSDDEKLLDYSKEESKTWVFGHIWWFFKVLLQHLWRDSLWKIIKFAQKITKPWINIE